MCLGIVLNHGQHNNTSLDSLFVFGEIKYNVCTSRKLPLSSANCHVVVEVGTLMVKHGKLRGWCEILSFTKERERDNYNILSTRSNAWAPN